MIIASNFLNDYSNNTQDAFLSGKFKIEKEVYYTIDPNNKIQTYSNATIRFDLHEIEEENKRLWFYSNPHISINNNN